MRPHIEDLHEVALGVELAGEEELLRADLELDDANTLERTDLAFARKRISENAPDSLICCKLGLLWEAPLRLGEARGLEDLALRAIWTRQSRPTDKAGLARP